MVGETFFHLSTDDISTELSAAKDGIKQRMVDLEEHVSECKTKMQTLKNQLYAKFGNHINLEEEEE